ncbi:MAG: 3-deoxy-D-manno-octulosonic acid transferase [Thermodesulfobacteriota bacterium]
MRFPLYSVLYGLAGLAAAPYYFYQGLRTGKYLWSLSARLGRVPPALPPKMGLRVWVHALSLGEVVSAAELVRRLARAGHEVCLSTTTLSGARLAAKRLAEIPRLCLPLDWPPAVRRTLKAVRPDLFVLVDSDIWPNVLAGLEDRRVPKALVNARVSPRSFAGYRLVRGFWRRVLGLFDFIGCQTPLDRERLLALGARPETTALTGNLKYDRPAPVTGPEVRRRLLAETGLPDGAWLAAGSTHPGEEEILLSLLKKLRGRFPGLRLLIAPRNSERFGAVWRTIERTGLPAGRRSDGGPYRDPAVFLLDTLGELDLFYELGDVVFVGKSLPVPGEGGGHNLLEPAARGKPVLFGPRMHNFPEVARLMLESGGGRRVEDAGGLEEAAAALLADESLRLGMGRRAQAAVEAHRGALDRTLGFLERVLKARPVP